MLFEHFEVLSLNTFNVGGVVACVVLLVTWIYLKRKDKHFGGKHLTEETVMIKSVTNKKDTQSGNFSSAEFEMLSKAEQLDMKNPSNVKKYVQELRQQAYKKKELSEEEQDMENQAKQRQLAQIHALLNQEKFGGEMSFDELNAQMALYT